MGKLGTLLTGVIIGATGILGLGYYLSKSEDKDNLEEINAEEYDISTLSDDELAENIGGLRDTPEIENMDINHTPNSIESDNDANIRIFPIAS